MNATPRHLDGAFAVIPLAMSQAVSHYCAPSTGAMVSTENGSPVLEYLVLEWDAKEWLKKQSAPLLKIARALKISDSAIHLWQKRHMTPLSFFKAAIMLTDVQAAPSILKKARLIEVSRGFNITAEMRHYAHAYDVHYQGQKIPLKSGGSITVTPSDAPVIEPTSGPSRLPVHPGGNGIGVVDTLLSLALKLKTERDAALQRAAIAESQYRLERARSEGAAKLIESLRQEVQEWQQLAEAASQPDRDLAPLATPEERREVEALVAQRSHTLAEELARLPK